MKRNLNPDINKIKEFSYRYLKFRLRSEFEINKYLKGKGYSEEDIKGCLNQLRDEGLLDDKRFAKFYAYDSLTIKYKGPFRIEMELKELGVERNIINDTIDDLRKEIDIKEIIREFLENQYRKTDINKIDKHKIRSKLYRRGFLSYDTEGVLNNYIDYRKED